MDPNACLKEIREICNRINDENVENNNDTDDLLRLVELNQALDEWICKGGSLPYDWRQGINVPLT